MKVFLVYTAFVLPLFGITNVGGYISSNTVWGPTGDPPDTVYNLISDIFVLDGVTLTIQPGVKVQSSSYALNIIGRLIACGTSGEKITFTSAHASPNPGDWTGIHFSTSSMDSSSLIHCNVEYAEWGISNFHEILYIENSRVAYCYVGIMPAGQDVIKNCEVAENTEVGICFLGLGDTLGPAISGTVINNNPIGLKIDFCQTLLRFPQPNYFTDNDIGIEITGDISVNDERVWDPAVGGTDCRVNGSIFGIGSSGKLTIAPGNTFKFLDGWMNIAGQMIACGTPAEKITFTSANASPNLNDWYGITFESSSIDTSQLIHCVIEWASTGIQNNVDIVQIENTRVEYCIDGIMVGGQGVVKDCEVMNNLLAGIYYAYQSDTLGPSISNTVIHNNQFGIKIENCYTLPQFPQPNYFTDNEVSIEIMYDVHVDDERVWDPAIGGIDCRVNCSIVWVGLSGKLTITPGNTFKFLGGWMNVEGQLIACGTSDEKITFTSAQPTPQPGDWNGIVLASTAGTCFFENCLIEYAYGALECFNDSVIIEDSEIFNSIYGIVIVHTNGIIENCEIADNQYGIHCDYDFDANRKTTDSLRSRITETSSRDSIPIYVHYNEICENNIGIWCTQGASPHIMFNEIYDNTEWGVYNVDNDYWIYAEYNWWGDSTGPCDTSNIDTLYNPNGLGDRVSDHVDYEPWIGYEPGTEELTAPVVITTTKFMQPKPNPFTNTIFLAYDLVKEQQVMIRIYNSLGQIVRKLIHGKDPRGSYKVHWDGKDNIGRQLPAGIYWCRFECEDLAQTEKIILVR